MRRRSGRGIVLRGAAWALGFAAAAAGIVATVSVAVGWSFAASTSPRAKLQMAMPAASVIVSSVQSDDDMPTGSIVRRYALASAAGDTRIFVPRLNFAVTSVPKTLAALSDAPDSKLKLYDAVPLPPNRPKLAYARPDFDMSPAPTEEDARTAVYDIEAHTVFLPSGRKLEAHSGYGQSMDDPSSMRLKMRGVTPPNTYRLKLRESLFHGVQALRMTPVDKDKMFGRDGILAHSYLLGPSGQSHGCISFRDYPAFLQAFMRGEVDRVVVLPRGGNQLASQLHGRALNKYAFDASSPPAATFRMHSSARSSAGTTRAASVQAPQHSIW